MSRQIFSLSDRQWQFGHVPRQPFDAPDVFDLPAVTEWLPAAVPGNVRPDLLALGRIPDPFVPQQRPASLWVEDVDWWYRCQLKADDLRPGRRAFLCFHGIDYLSAIFINGRERARHEGMFSRQTIELTGDLRHGGLDVAVRLWGSGALPRRRLSPPQRLWKTLGERLYRSWVGIYANRTATLKCQMSFGWDFAPPLRAIGLWDEVQLLTTGPVFIQELGIRNQQSGDPAQLSAVSLDLLLHAANSTPATATVTVNPANFQADAFGPFRFDLHLPAGQSDVSLRCPLPNVARWQPWDAGFPHLYDVSVTLTGPDGQPLDALTRRTGFRTVELRSHQLIINGQPRFARGLNWVPADSFPGRLRSPDYRRLLQQARNCGANLLRVWGGGLREKSAFYHLCDELGLLVWQEFPFACEFLGAYPRDPAYLTFVARECGDMVRQLQPHPSVVVWCGGNEFSRWRNRPLLQTLVGVVRRFDGDRPFVPTSPGPGDAHNWQVWHGLEPFAAYQRETAAFLSEFGLQALPESMNNEQLTMNNVLARNGDPVKLARYADLFNEQLVISNEQLTNINDENLAGNDVPDRSTHSQLLPPNPQLEIQNSKLKIQKSQLAQAVALQTAIEHMRRRKGEAGGVCLWQFNEPWPAVSWAIVDYFGRPKLAYERLKTWYAPLLVSLEFPVGQRWLPGDTFSAGIWLINDGQTAITNYHLTITHSAGADGLLYAQTGDLPADTIICVGRVSHQLAGPPQWITATLRRDRQILCQNHYPLAWHDDRRGSGWLRLRRWLAHWATQ